MKHLEHTQELGSKQINLQDTCTRVGPPLQVVHRTTHIAHSSLLLKQYNELILRFFKPQQPRIHGLLENNSDRDINNSDRDINSNDRDIK